MAATAEYRGRHSLLVTAVVLAFTWSVAGLLNANGFIMGNTPSAAGVVASLAAVCVWPVAGWFAGSQSGQGFLRLTTVFWIMVIAGTPLMAWGYVSGPGMTALLLLVFALAAPVYGLAALLPTWDPFAWETLLWTVVIGLAALSMTLATYCIRRRIGMRSVQADLG
jgi:hypothetical protein